MNWLARGRQLHAAERLVELPGEQRRDKWGMRMWKAIQHFLIDTNEIRQATSHLMVISILGIGIGICYERSLYIAMALLIFVSFTTYEWFLSDLRNEYNEMRNRYER